MTPLEKADRAKQLLNDALLNEIMQNIRDGLTSGLENSAMGDAETHHEIALSLQMLKRIKTELHRYLQAATIDKHKEKQESFMQRMRQTLG